MAYIHDMIVKILSYKMQQRHNDGEDATWTTTTQRLDCILWYACWLFMMLLLLLVIVLLTDLMATMKIIKAIIKMIYENSDLKDDMILKSMARPLRLHRL